jgi:hypothetical protein
MADERYKYVSTFVLPDEYQRQATEARRRRRMAEMLAQQAYQPSDIRAPIPAAAPLVQGLQAFLAARAERKADEAEETAKQTAGKEARDFLRALTEPEKKMDVGQAAIESINQMGTPELVDGRLEYRKTALPTPTPEMIPQAGPQISLGRKPEDDQVYMPTATGRETDPQKIAALLANPQMKAGFTQEQRRGLAMQGLLASDNPMVQKIAGAIYPTLQPEKTKLQLGNIDPAKFTPASIAQALKTGNVSDLRAISPPSESRIGKPSPGDFTPRSLAEFEKTGDPSVLVPVPKVAPTTNIINRYGAPMAAVDAQGNPVLIQPSQTGGKPSVVEGFAPPPSSGQAMNEGQSNSATFADRMAISMPELDRPAPSRTSQALSEIPYGIGAGKLSAEDQKFLQARDDFIAAVLRKESGAVIGVDERKDAERQYIPQPGDKPPLLEQKRRAREAAFAGMQRAAGPSYKPTIQTLPQSAKDMGVTQQDWDAMTPEQRKLFN